MVRASLAVACMLSTWIPSSCDSGANVPPPAPVADERRVPARSPPPEPGREPGAIVGRVVYRGPLPDSTTMYIAEAGELEAHTTIVDAASRGLKDAVVWVDGLPPAPAPDRVAILDQRGWIFVPHVLAVRVGQEVRFRNSEPVNHTVRSFTPGHAFNVGTPVGVGVTRRFRRPTHDSPVRIECDVHEWMLAWVYVFEHDGFAVTDARGEFRIDDVPAGSHRLRVHHADGALANAAEIRVNPQGSTRVTLELGERED